MDSIKNSSFNVIAPDSTTIKSEVKDKKPPEESGTKDTVNLNSSGKAPEKDLTVLFYMHGQYKDISENVAEALINLEGTGTGEKINVVAQLGRDPYVPKDSAIETGEFHVPIDGDWVGVRRYEVRQGDHSNLDTPVEKYQELEKEMPENPLLKYVIGDSYWDKGDKDTARKYFDEAKKLGIVEYMNNHDSARSKEVRKEFNEKTRSLDEAIADKKVYSSKMVEQLGPEIKMGKPATLENFIEWGLEKYPAKNHVLVVMAHGGAWIGAAEINPGDMAQAIKSGVKEANEATGRQDKIDALVFNSCYMGSAESTTEMKDTADIALVSENYATTGAFRDWAHFINTIDGSLKEGIPFDARKLADEMVEYYRGKNQEVRDNFPEFTPFKQSYLTLTAIDNKKLGALVDSWKKFVDSCYQNRVKDSDLFKAVEKAKNYPSSAMNPSQVFGFYDQIRDMGSIMDEVAKSDAFPAKVKEDAENVKKALADTIINEQHLGKNMEGSHGLTVWGPVNGVDVALMGGTYGKDVKEFALETGWGDKLIETLQDLPKPVLSDFLTTLKQTRELRAKINDPNTSEEEKKQLQVILDAKQEHLLDVKKEMAFTIDRPESIYKTLGIDLDTEAKPFEDMIEQLKRDIPRKNGMA